MNKETERHLGNISRMVGHDVTHRYSYITSESELIDAWLKLHEDLNYPLMVDSRYHRALIYNREGLEKFIQDNLINNMKQAFDELANIATNDIEKMLNNIIQTKDGKIIIDKSNNTNSTINLIANATAKGLVKGIFNLLDEITRYDDDDYKRR